MENMFRKGQKVTLLQNWDGKGTYRVSDLIVASCGKKQMILVDENGVKFEGSFFAPRIQQDASYFGVDGGVNEVHPRMTAEEAEIRATELAAQFIKAGIAYWQDRLTNWRDVTYVPAAERKLAEFQAATPKVVRR